MESLPLVEALFGDLLHTTESLRQSKLKLSKRQDLEGAWEINVEPYKNENARLVRENNDLHQELLTTREQLDNKLRELKVTVRRLEHENADLKFLNNQYVHKVRAHEKQSRSKDDKIAQLQEKNLQAVVQTPGGRKKQIPFRRQRMEVDATLSTPSEAPALGVCNPDPFFADMMKVADQRQEQLQMQVGRLEESERASSRAIQSLRRQVDTRDKEIERLTRMLEGGRPAEVILSEGKRETNEKLVAHLNIQVDYLQQANAELEQQLRAMQTHKDEAEHATKDLTAKNAKLCGELEEINELTRQLESEKRARLKELESELKSTRRLNEQREKGFIDVKKELNDLRREHKALLVDSGHTADMLASAEEEVKRTNQMMDRMEQEKEDLTDRYNKLSERGWL
jgi:centrosomal protein CEP135